MTRRRKPRVILSTGPGRLHLVQSATYLSQRDVDMTLVQGWIPRRTDSWLVGALASLAGHKHLAAGLKKRRPAEFTGAMKSCGTAEFLHTFFTVTARKTGLLPAREAGYWGWRLFGSQTKRHLHDADIFHVRSGAGRGGAIACAKRHGMVVIADHSIAHPAFMKRHLGPEYAEAGLPFTFGPEDPLWTGVLQDCDEADIVLVSSDFVKDTFVEAGMSPNKIEVAYLGVRSDFQGLKRDYSLPPRLRLVFTGGFGLRKGAKYILQALQLLDRAGVDYEFTIAGATTEAGGLFEQMPVAGTIRRLGHIPQDDLKGLLAESDIYLFPSLAEGFSSSLFEAMSAGVPVITTIESTARILDGVEGCVVPSKNAAAIAEKIVWLRDNPHKLESIGRAAAKLVRDRYTWDHYADDVVRVYESAMDRRGETDRA